MHRNVIAAFAAALALTGLVGCSRTVDDVAKWQTEGNVEKLTKALTDPKVEVREAAANSLGKLKAEGTIDALAARFNDSEESVVIASVQALSSIGSKSAVTPLIAALKLGSPTARATAAKGLGPLKAASAIAPLAELLNDSDQDVQLAAIAAIGKIGNEDGSQPLVNKLNASSAPALRKACIDALGDTRGNVALKALVDALADSDEQISKAATTSLIKIGDPALPSIMDGLKSENQGVRAAAVALLRGLSAIPTRGYGEVWYLIARATTDESKEIDFETVKMLAKLGTDAVTPLMEAAGHGDPEVRDYACLALETIGEACASKVSSIAQVRATGDAMTWFKGRSEWSGAPSWRLDLWGSATALNPEFDYNAAKVTSLKAGGAAAASVLSRSDFTATRAYMPLVIKLLDDDACSAAASKKLVDAGYKASFPLMAALADTNNAVANGAAAILGPQKDPRAYQPLLDALQRRIDAGELLSNNPIYTALVALDRLEADSVVLKVRPNTDRAIQVFERQYHDARIIGAETTDPYTDNEAPITFRLAFQEKGKSGQLQVTFRKDSRGDWRPSPAMPYKLPVADSDSATDT